MTKNKRILHIMSSDGGGISSFIKNKALALKDQEIIFDVLTYNSVSEEFYEAIKLTGGRIYYMPNPKKKKVVGFIKKVNSAMKKNGSDTIIHSHIQGYRFIPFYLIAKLNKIKKVIVHAHTDLEPKQNKSISSKINRVVNRLLPIKRISCGIKASRTIFGYKLSNQHRIMHIPNSIESSKFVSSLSKRALKSEIFGAENVDKLIIGNVARFNKQKNHNFMVSVIEKLAAEKIDFIWVFVGKGELEEAIKLKISEANLDDYVMFLGHRSDVPDVLKAMDLLVLPSLYEGLPTVAIESQAAGTPILLSDSITKECDLDLGLSHFVPLKVEEWVKVIVKNDFESTSNSEILEALEEKKFTNQKSAELYLSFINDEIKTYDI